MNRFHILTLAAALLAGPALAQRQSDLPDLVSGKIAPLTLKLKELGPDWRRLAITSSLDPVGMVQQVGAMFGGGGVHYTKGQTVTLNDETFIVAYRVPPKRVDPAALMRPGSGPEVLLPDKLTPDTALTLSLVNVRSIGSISDVRPFDLQKELSEDPAANPLLSVFGNAREAAQKASSQSNLKQLALGVMMYAQDHDEKLPPMKSAAALKKAIMPYVKSETVFTDPNGDKAYMANPSLSGKSLASIANPAEIALLYEAEAGPDGSRSVAFVDGHVKRLTASEWATLKKRSKIP